MRTPLSARGPRPQRRSSRPFPPYAFLPGGPHPHPARAAAGYGRERFADSSSPWVPERWRSLEPYLYAVDLYNYDYWWESHEALEGLWHAAGRTSLPARFVQGLIHAAAAAIHARRGSRAGARRQAARALARLEEVARSAGTPYMGLAIPPFATGLREAFVEPAAAVANAAASPGASPPRAYAPPIVLLG